MSMRFKKKEDYLKNYWSIKFGGKAVTGRTRRLVTEITIEEADNEAHLGRVQVDDVGFIFSETYKIKEDMPVVMDIGHENKHKVKLKGKISHIEANYGNDGIPKITIGIVDNTIAMTSKKKTREFKKMTSSSVVTKIAKEYGFKAKIQATTEVHDKIQQNDESDAQLISRLADEEAFKMFLLTDSNELYWGDKIPNPTPKDTLWYNQTDHTILTFKPTLVAKNKPGKDGSETQSKSRKTKKTSKKASKNSSSAGKGNGKGNGSNALPKGGSDSTGVGGINTVTGAVKRPK